MSLFFVLLVKLLNNQFYLLLKVLLFQLHDLVHFDIWRPVPTPTMRGSQYYVLFIDDYSKFTWIYMMKNQHELPQI